MRQLKYLVRSLALSFPSWKEFVKIGARKTTYLKKLEKNVRN
jgi:hypothetical protein